MTSNSTDKDLPQLVDDLVAGFETLLSTVGEHIENEKALRDRLEFAANEVSMFSSPRSAFLRMRNT